MVVRATLGATGAAKAAFLLEDLLTAEAPRCIFIAADIMLYTQQMICSWNGELERGEAGPVGGDERVFDREWE